MKTFYKRILSASLAASAVFSATGQSVAVPAAVPYVGQLAYSNGVPFQGAVQISARLLDAPTGGALVWGPASWPTVEVQGGVFSIVLGTGGAPLDPSALTGPLYLDLEINGVPMLPRQMVLSVPFALKAGDAEQLGGYAASNYPRQGSAIDISTLSQGGQPLIGPGGQWLGSPSGLQGPQGPQGAQGPQGPQGPPGEGGGVSGGSGASAANPGRSCLQILLQGHSVGSTSYWIDPDGGDPSNAFVVYCDMATNGGGWTRVANVAADVPICNMTLPLGTPAQVNSTLGSTTAWLAASTVDQIPWNREILAYQNGNTYFHFKSHSAALRWSQIAGGELTSANIGDHMFSGGYKSHGAYGLSVNNGCTTASGSCLLGGGWNGTTTWTFILGIGRYAGSTSQFPTCAASIHRGMFNGSAWNTPGAVYIR